MIYKVDFEGQACKQIKEKAESYQYDLKSVLKGIGLLIADMWLPGDSKPQINTWEGLFEKVQEDYSYKDTIVENDFICSISNDDGISIIIEIADETIVDFKDIKSSILQVRDFLLANKWSGAIPDFLPIEQKEIRNMMNETERSIPFKCLHEAFFECAYRFPDKTALEWLSLDEKWETLSYEALKIKVLQTASMLKQEGVHTRDKVAIVLPKGENQIIAVLAILSIGATYVPIGIHQPLDRKKKIFEAGNISYALTDSNRSMVMWKYGKLLPYVPAEVEKTNMYICNEIENMRCFPYFDDESEYLCQKYGLSEGRWHMCISGENTLKVLERARYDYQVNKDKTLRNICRASKLDCFGTTGITKFVCSIAGMVSNEVIEKSLLLTSSNPSRLTGSVAAATVLTILEMGMERGSFLLSKSKINLEVMKKLLNIGTEIRVSIRDNIGSDEIEGEI